MKYPRSPKDPWEYEASSDICCLLIHGYTGYPFEMRPVSEALVASNIAHRVLRLPGHGERPEALNKYKWHDWYKAAEDAYLDLRRSYEKVIIIGLSMGGSLALHLAAHHHPDGVVTMGSPGNSFLKRLQYTCLIAGFRNKRRKRFRSVYYYKTASENLGYSKQTFISLCQLHRLLYHLQDDLMNVRAPLLLFHSKNDRTVPYEQMDFIAKRVNSADLETNTLEQSNHVLPWDNDSEKVIAGILEFIEKKR